ncbi:MAG: GNAT family N-acetyltransferase, partial [Chloroflexota bacterium]|nr:GNAT family N-acetyltransferase [Chloroflexota bacterium]
TEEIEVAYLLDKPYWGQGLATEAARAALSYAFDTLQLDRIVAVTRPENKGSKHVLDKIGLKFERHAHYYKLDCSYYSISRERYYDANSKP